MNAMRWCKNLGIATIGVTLACLAGCQTHLAGMTLPSGYYLDHKPQYFRPDPDFPLERELATMQAQDSLINGGGRPAEVAAPGVAPGAAGAPGAIR